MNGACKGNFFGQPPLGPGEGSKGQISFNFNYKVNFKDFYKCGELPNFVFVLTNERYKTYQTGFLFSCLGHVAGVGLSRAWGAEGVKKIFKHGHVTYQIDGDDKQNRMQVNFST